MTRSAGGAPDTSTTGIMPSNWSTPPAALETHISVLTFVGDRAYKLHKPVRTAFLDHSTRRLRAQACHDEVLINRRFAPDVYLGVADIVDEGGQVRDHMIVMRRMPADRQLTRLLDRPEASEHLARVARILTDAHAEQPPIRRPGVGDRHQVGRLWHEGTAQMAPFTADIVDASRLIEVARLARRYLCGRGPLFRSRVERGWIRDGHGDLLADDIYCLPDGPRMLDCLAFDVALRVSDTLSDVAFLGMDLESRGHPELTDVVLRAYAQHVGDRFPPSLAYHYLAYRAFVRAKIACLAARQGRDGKARRARELLTLCERYLEHGRVRLVLVGGPPGTGKSTLAAGLADTLGLAVIRSDAVRKELVGLAPTTSAAAAFQEGIYDAQATDAVYATMLERARDLLSRGVSVVLDASWSDSSQRSRARRVGTTAAADLIELRCELPEEVARQRIVDRDRRGEHVSDATPAIASRMRQRFAPWPEAMTIDTSPTPHRLVETASSRLGFSRPVPGWARSTQVGETPLETDERRPSVIGHL